MSSIQPPDKIQIMRRSLRCFACGLIGILPGIGLPFAVTALGDCFYVSRHKGTTPNPAQRYLRWGAVAATAGLLLTLLLGAVLLIELSGPSGIF